MNTTANIRELNIVLRNTPLEQLRLSVMAARFSTESDVSTEASLRNLFVWIATHTVSVSGLPTWQPPALSASTEDLQASFETLLTEVADFGVLNAWVDEIMKLRQPTADKVEKPESALTDEEKKVPNSRRKGRRSKSAS